MADGLLLFPLFDKAEYMLKEYLTIYQELYLIKYHYSKQTSLHSDPTPIYAVNARGVFSRIKRLVCETDQSSPCAWSYTSALAHVIMVRCHARYRDKFIFYLVRKWFG
jgi:hypothetical protein